jgi:hypothetical protein
MAEENEKKEGKLIHETPEVEKPPVLSPETHKAMPGAPPTAPSPVLEKLPEKYEEKRACQWFIKRRKFCDKIKKNVRCGGDVGKCPF